MLVEEHSALRAEIIASYGYAQSIVKWTLATFAALTAAGLVAINNATAASRNPVLINVILVLFGLGLPGIIWLNATTWLGELYRAERAGSYLRALEADIANLPHLRDRLGFEPLRWERFLWVNRKAKGLWGKQVMTYLGTAGTFFGTAVGSFLILVFVIERFLTSNALSPAEFAWVWMVASAATHLLCIGVCGYLGTRLFRLGDAVAPLEATYPSSRA